MRVLVLGAGGFIGRRIVAAMVRRHGPGSILAGVRRLGVHADMEAIAQCVVDAEDAGSVRASAEGVTHVVNCVMGTNRAIVESARNVAGLVRDGLIEGAVHLSSIAVYGLRSGAILESDPLGPPADGYAAAKIAAERLFVEVADDRGIIIRPGLVYGPGSQLWTHRIGQLVASGRLGPLGRRGEVACPLVHVDDVADAVVIACDTVGVNGRAYTLVAAPALTWNTYLADMAAALNVPVRPISAGRLYLERVLAYPLTAIRSVLGKINIDAPEAITPGLARLFGVRMDFESSAVGTLLPAWRDYSIHLKQSVMTLVKNQDQEAGL